MPKETNGTRLRAYQRAPFAYPYASGSRRLAGELLGLALNNLAVRCCRPADQAECPPFLEDRFNLRVRLAHRFLGGLLTERHLRHHGDDDVGGIHLTHGRIGGSWP